MFKADYNLRILNFEGVLLVFYELKTNAFKSWRNILIYTRYCFSSIRKFINGLEILALYLIYRTKLCRQTTLGPIENALGCIQEKGNNNTNKFPRPYCKQSLNGRRTCQQLNNTKTRRICKYII